MTPGTVLGLYEAWQGYGSGKLSWRELVEPAIPYAENGIPLTEKLALWYIKPSVDEGFPRGVEILRVTKACERLWYKKSLYFQQVTPLFVPLQLMGLLQEL